MTCSLTLARKSYHTKNTAWFSTAVLKLIYNDTNFLSKHYFPFTALFLVYGLLFAAFMRAHFQQLQRYSLKTFHPSYRDRTLRAAKSFNITQ